MLLTIPASELRSPAGPPAERRRRRLVMRLGEALHRYGTPAHRLENALTEVAARLATFLGLDDAQQRGVAQTFATHRPGKTMQRSFGDVLTLDRVDWPEEQKQTFRARCREAMELAGYDGEGGPMQPRE